MMARLLLSVEVEMTDKTKPDTPNEHTDYADRGDGAATARETPPVTAVPTDTPSLDQFAAALKQTNPPKPSLITALEIENFKGIGAPVHIDLRPITLLFGRNSAGKSTIIQALCYAHEILSHRNVNVHKTDLGGEQIDLGGFRQFVHGHDMDRVVRLRFELNLDGWNLPVELAEKMVSRYVDSFDGDRFHGWLTDSCSAKLAGPAWVEVAVQATHTGTAALEYYEVGIDGARVGRIQKHAELEINWGHPLLTSLSGTDIEFELQDCIHIPGMNFQLPNWQEPLPLPNYAEEWVEGIKTWGFGNDDIPNLMALLSCAFIGVGAALRDALAQLRYLGPVRELRPSQGSPMDPHNLGHWSDGSAAWSMLQNYEPPHAVLLGINPGLLDDVNHWLADTNKLDTGLKVRQRLVVKIPTDEPPAKLIREHATLLARYRNDQGHVDIDRAISDLLGNISTAKSQHHTIETGVRKHFEALAARIERLERGEPASDVRTLVLAIADPHSWRELELVIAETGVDVRTSDIGVGISQILPVVVAALDRARPGLTAIEQPELHVHPKMQVELGDLFAQGIDQGGIFLIETHSEHLLLRLMRRMRQTSEGTLPDGAPSLLPEDVSVLFVEPDGDQTLVRQMPLNERGELVKAWPGGFFEEDMREIFDIREQP